MTDPVTSMRDFLDQESSVPYTAGTDLWVGPIRPNPTDQLVVQESPGIPPKRTMGNSVHIRRAVAQILLRHSTYIDGHDDMRAILDVLQGASISGFEDVITQESEPGYLGQDDSGNHRWQLNVEMVYIRSI